MTSPLETIAAANSTLDEWGNAVVQGANTAPRLTIDSIIALRAILTRHRPYLWGRCVCCELNWPCPDAQDVLKVLGLPEHGDEGAS